VLAFDSDSAGLAAAVRSVEMFRQAEVEVRVVTLPPAHDPDVFIRERGGQEFEALILHASPILDWQVGQILAGAAGGDRHDWVRAVDKALDLIARIPPGAEREDKVASLQDKIRLIVFGAGPRSPRQTQDLERALTAARDRIRRGISRSRDSVVQRDVLVRHLEPTLLAAILQHGELAARCVTLLQPEDFTEGGPRLIYEAIAQLVRQGGDVNAKALLAVLGPEERGLAAELALQPAPADDADRLVEGALRRLAERRLERRQRLLTQRLREAASGDEQRALRAEIAEVSAQRRQLVEQMRG
jgi:DNA primase